MDALDGMMVALHNNGFEPACDWICIRMKPKKLARLAWRMRKLAPEIEYAPKREEFAEGIRAMEMAAEIRRRAESWSQTG